MSVSQELKLPQVGEVVAQTSPPAVEGKMSSPGTSAAQQPQQSSSRDEVLAMLEDAYGPSIWESAVRGLGGAIACCRCHRSDPNINPSCCRLVRRSQLMPGRLVSWETVGSFSWLREPITTQ